MKNRYIFCFLLLSNTALQSMETKVKVLPAWKEKENILANRFKNILEKSFNKYNGKSTIYPDDLINAGKQFGLSEPTIKETLKEIRLNNGDTLIHLFVIYERVNELIKFANQDMLFLKENNAKLTAFDIAFERFNKLTDTEITTLDKICKKRCIYLILLNYSKSNEFTCDNKEIIYNNKKVIWCCDFHSL